MNTFAEHTLNTRIHPQITLVDAIKHCIPFLYQDSDQNSEPDCQPIALLYTPDRCEFATVNADGSLNYAPHSQINLDSVFEARVFSPVGEFRWLNDWHGVGRAALLSEADISVYLQPATAGNLQYITTINQQYVLWGQGSAIPARDDAANWSQLTMARIGAIAVPVSHLQQGRVYLRTVEYVSLVDQHGNVAVVEERLEKLSKQPLSKQSEVKS